MLEKLVRTDPEIDGNPPEGSQADLAQVGPSRHKRRGVPGATRLGQDDAGRADGSAERHLVNSCTVVGG